MEEHSIDKEALVGFLRRSYHDFVGREIADGRAIPSQNDFARWLGVKNTSLSLWMNGYRVPAGESVHKLAAKLGPELYDLVGVPRTIPGDPRLQVIVNHWQDLSQNQQESLVQMVIGYLGAKGIRISP